MPRIWTETIASHKEEVRDAVLDVIGDLVEVHSVFGASMSTIAERAGIGRATLYKYFADIGSMVTAWHVRQIHRHTDQLAEAGHAAGPADVRLRHVLDRHAQVLAAHHSDAAVTALLPAGHDEGTSAAQERLLRLVESLIGQGVAEGVIRDDVPPRDLAGLLLGAAASAAHASAPDRVLDIVMLALSPI